MDKKSSKPLDNKDFYSAARRQLSYTAFWEDGLAKEVGSVYLKVLLETCHWAIQRRPNPPLARCVPPPAALT